MIHDIALNESIDAESIEDPQYPLSWYLQSMETSYLNGQWDRATIIFHDGIKRFPNNFDLTYQSIKLLVHQAYWSEAIIENREKLLTCALDKMECLFRHYYDQFTPEHYLEFGIVLQKMKRYDESKSILREGIQKYPDNVPLYVILSKTKDKDNNFIKRALSYTSRIFTDSLIISDHASRNIRQLFSFYEYGKITEMSDRCFRETCNNKLDAAMKTFKLITDTFTNSETKDVWNDTYTKLLSIKGESYNDSEYTITGNSVPKILVAGMGWSGSGALLYYFNEFKNVDLFEEEEFMFIRGHPGLIHIHNSIANNRPLENVILRMFWYTLFGLGKYSTPNELESCRQAMKYVFGKESVQFARSVNNFIHNMTVFKNSDVKGIGQFELISSEFIDSLASIRVLNNDHYSLMNNVLDIHNIEYCNLVSNSHILCSIRDPRSQYVSYIRANPGYVNNTKFLLDFINSYRLNIERLQSMKKNGNADIQIVRFEEFVSNEL
ncbi:MAG: tetratricopeptide repeat protein [Eubacteriales bacterium]